MVVLERRVGGAGEGSSESEESYSDMSGSELDEDSLAARVFLFLTIPWMTWHSFKLMLGQMHLDLNASDRSHSPQ